jgi:hypothetical protein
MTAERVPDELIIGMIDGQWPVVAFTTEGHAIAWFSSRSADHPAGKRRLWRVKIVGAVELELTQPVERRLIERVRGEVPG